MVKHCGQSEKLANLVNQHTCLMVISNGGNQDKCFIIKRLITHVHISYTLLKNAYEKSVVASKCPNNAKQISLKATF